MANSYTQINIHFVFATNERFNYFASLKRKEILAYMIGISTNLKCYVHAIEGCHGHVHMLVSLKSNMSTAEYAQKVKGNTSKHINENKYFSSHFEWQEGYGAFSVSQSKIEDVKRYIQNQEEHHKSHSFHEEFQSMLVKYHIPFNEKYLFQ